MTDASTTAVPPPAIEAVMREQALAVGYAPASARDGFAALLDLDHQLASILQSTTEPMIGQMRLTWWYEALEKLDREPAPAHPVLQRLAASVLPGGVRGADLAPMIEGWEALLDDGEPLVAYGFEAAREKRFMRGSGLPIQIATVELIEIGAGGGSIARLDEMKRVQVGPDSAGSEPGPACYARGGTHATVTDADCVMGYLDAERFAGGRVKLDSKLAEQAVANAIAGPLAVNTELGALAINAFGPRLIRHWRYRTVLMANEIGRAHV